MNVCYIYTIQFIFVSFYFGNKFEVSRYFKPYKPFQQNSIHKLKYQNRFKQLTICLSRDLIQNILERLS